MNPSFSCFSTFDICGMTVEYFRSDNSVMSFRIIPASMKNAVVPHRGPVKDTVAAKKICQVLDIAFPSITAEPMVQYKCLGDSVYAGHAPGVSMRNSASVYQQQFVSQTCENGVIRTVFEDPRGLRFTHEVAFGDSRPYLLVNTTVENIGACDITLEEVSSFSLGMMSPFQNDDGPESYRLYRCQSNWSAEGRLVAEDFELANLEMSWQASSVRGVRFGQNISVPVKQYFPFVAVEDKKAGVVWGAQLAAIGPWMLEVTRLGDWFNISGGIPDREFGQWYQTLKPGEALSGIPAIVSCVCGDVQDLCNRLVRYQDELPLIAPDRDLPLNFNDWCHSWGEPTVEQNLPIAQMLSKTPVKNMILDVGWYKSLEDKVNWGIGIGDWEIYQPHYHGSLMNFVDEVHDLGINLGIWYELEIATTCTNVFKEHPEFFLTCDGKIIKMGERVFLDFRRKDVWDYLEQRIIEQIRNTHIHAVKIDYNAQIPYGCDGRHDSKLANLLEHLKGVDAFYKHLRKTFPELILEICCSGGHRLSPYWLHLTTYMSSSDAHEGLEAPIIAANVLTQVVAYKSEVWCVLHANDSPQRLAYTLCGGLLGRMSLSGEIDELSPAQQQILEDAMAFTVLARNIIKDGAFRVEAHRGLAFLNPHGYQIVRGSTPTEEMIVIHAFGDCPEKLSIPGGTPIRIFNPANWQLDCQGGMLEVSGIQEYSAIALLIKK